MSNEKRVDCRFDGKTPKPAPAPQPEAVNKPLSDVAMALLLGFLAGTIAVGLATLAFIFL